MINANQCNTNITIQQKIINKINYMHVLLFYCYCIPLKFAFLFIR